MADRRIDSFFYGLFMDSEVLLANQVTAADPRRAYVDSFALRIGRRATLVPAPGECAYGMVYALTHDELARLYSAPGLEHYRPEAILACLLEGETVPALCYNLREAPGPGETNVEYATRLRTALARLDFPPEYVASIS